MFIKLFTAIFSSAIFFLCKIKPQVAPELSTQIRLAFHAQWRLNIFWPYCAFCGKPNFMDTDGSYLKKKSWWKGLFALSTEVRIIPVGLTSAEVRCLLAMSHHDSSPTSAELRARRLPFDWLILSFEHWYCTRMTNCRQDALRCWKAPRLFLKTPSFHYALGTRKLIERYCVIWPRDSLLTRMISSVVWGIDAFKTLTWGLVLFFAYFQCSLLSAQQAVAHHSP